MNELEKQVEYKLSEVISIFSSMIIENGVDNFLDDVDFCIYTEEFIAGINHYREHDDFLDL